jgi:uncharacterized RDD family membrane protein YckC
MRKELPINNADDLAFEYGRSALLRRWLAATVDLLTIVAVMGACINGFPVFREGGSGLIIPITIVFWFCYFFFFESLLGATPGKFLANLRVVDINGNPPGMQKGAIRTLMRLFEANPVLFGSLPAIISIYTSTVSQRIGDRFAGTYVVRRKDLRKIVAVV